MMTQEPFFSTLNNRGLINISGAERRKFLQGLITNDVNLLDMQDCVYTCLLTPQGKFLYDFFITEHDETLILDCEGQERLTSLAKLLTLYKLRADITIDIKEDTPVYGIISAPHGHIDPRHSDMGYRSFQMPEHITEQPFASWDKHRIALTIPDGSRDLIPQKSTMDEGHMDQINAVDYKKGCYLGQELTARMHYRGLGKKHLHTITHQSIGQSKFPAPLETIIKDGKAIGEMRSSCGDMGIALLNARFTDTDA